MTTHYQKAQFLLSVADTRQLPPDKGYEVAIVGRSNAGKSSVLNCMTQLKNLARVSKTPGRTQLINMFGLDDHRRIADLPGYGFASVPPEVQRNWQQLIDTYIHNRTSLKGLILVMDIRHPCRTLDLQLLEFCQHNQLAVHILLNKADKLSKNAATQTLHRVKATLADFHDSVTLQLFSAAKRSGVNDLHVLLDHWYEW